MSDKPQNGKRMYEYHDGSVYDGEWRDGKRNGQGIYESDEILYVGEWKDDIMNGKGKLDLDNGDIYEGEFLDGKKHGKGTLNSYDGRKYVGDFVNGVIEGNGILTVSSTKTRYEGQFKNGQIEGIGTYTYPSGGVYKGEFLKGFPNGDGILTEANGNTLEGYRKRNKDTNKVEMIGPVIYTLTNGDIYEGQWNNSTPNGSGKFTYSNGIVIAGNWVNGKCVEEYPKLKITKSVLNGCIDVFTLEPIKDGDIITLHNPKIQVDMFDADTTIGEPVTKQNTRNICPYIFSKYSFDEYIKTNKINPTTRGPMAAEDCKTYVLNIVDESESRSPAKPKPRSRSRSKSRSSSPAAGARPMSKGGKRTRRNRRYN
jgi:hypothetical protein